MCLLVLMSIIPNFSEILQNVNRILSCLCDVATPEPAQPHLSFVGQSEPQ